MNKTKIATAFAVILSSFSAPLMAETLDEELERAANELKDISIEELMADEYFNILELDDSVEMIEEPTVTETVKVATTKVEAVEEKNDDSMDVLSFDDIQTETIATNAEDLVFLRYVPEGTRLTVNDSFRILPKKKYIILHEGKRVLKNPQTQADPEKTFCYVELKPSGKARILKSGKQFQVTSTKSTVNDNLITKSYGDYILRTQKIDFRVNNENVRSISCVAAEMFKKGEESPTPLMIKDLKEQTGDIFSIAYPAYEEI